MKSILSILAATALIAPGAMAAEGRGNGAHPLARILFFPLMPFIELQAELSPDKASCWNDGADEVVGCQIAEEFDDAVANRPTPYVE